MGKQTEKRNETSKKNYSFTGHRTIGNSKSNYVAENNFDVSSDNNNITDEIRKILDFEDHQGDDNQMGMFMNANNMNNQMMANQMMNNQMMGVPMMNNQMMGANSNPLNNFGGDIDPTMVNNLVPISSNQMPNMGSNLLNPSQMAQAMGSLANLSKLSNVQTIGNAYTEQMMSETMANPMMANPMMTNPMMTNPMMANPMNASKLANLANLNTLKSL